MKKLFVSLVFCAMAALAMAQNPITSKDTVYVSIDSVQVVYNSPKTGEPYSTPKFRVLKYGNAMRVSDKTNAQKIANKQCKLVGVVFNNYANGERKISKVIAK
jgi:hypothetical protein